MTTSCHGHMTEKRVYDRLIDAVRRCDLSKHYRSSLASATQRGTVRDCFFCHMFIMLILFNLRVYITSYVGVPSFCFTVVASDNR